MMKAIGLMVFVLLVSPAVYAQKSYTVGEASGWDSTVNYGNWVKGKTFNIGDSLVFNYDFTHAVDEVSKDDYTNCNAGNAISSETSSPTTITLSAAGTRYFLCPRSNHCSQGMKLAVTVAASSTSPATPSGGGTTPSPTSGGSTPSTPKSTTSSPPPPSGSGAAALGGGVMVALSLFVGAMLG